MERVKIDNAFQRNVVVSVYDRDDFFLITIDKKMYKRDEEQYAIEVTDVSEMIRVLNLFEPKETDVIHESDDWIK